MSVLNRTLQVTAGLSALGTAYFAADSFGEILKSHYAHNTATHYSESADDHFDTARAFMDTVEDSKRLDVEGKEVLLARAAIQIDLGESDLSISNAALERGEVAQENAQSALITGTKFLTATAVALGGARLTRS